MPLIPPSRQMYQWMLVSNNGRTEMMGNDAEVKVDAGSFMRAELTVIDADGRAALMYISFNACSGPGDACGYRALGASLCIQSLGDDAADRPVHVGIMFPTCLSSSCDTKLDATCTVTREGTSLRVESSASVRSLGGNHVCTTDCGLLIAECKSAAVPAGKYTLRYGERSAHVTLPTVATKKFMSFVLAACGGSGFDACGGNPKGTWKVVGFELDDPQAFIDQSFQDEPACDDVSGDVQLAPGGSYVFGKDMSLKIDFALGADMDVTLDQDCVQALSKSKQRVDDASCTMLADDFENQLGMKAASCAAKGQACACSLSTADVSGSNDTTYAVKGHQLVVGGATQARDFCVRGDRLEIKVEQGALGGVMVLER